MENKFLCEVYTDKTIPGHCPFPGVVVRYTEYKGKRLRTILCGSHEKCFPGWDVLPLQEYREKCSLAPDAPIIGGRIWPNPDVTDFVESSSNAETATERNMWIAAHRAVLACAEWRYWLGHYAAYPLSVNLPPLEDARSVWKRAEAHADGMYRVYSREDHEQLVAGMPDRFRHSIVCKAAEILRTRKP